MHIPDGYLGPETVAAGWAICAPVWFRASRKTRDLLTEPKAVPVLAASAAFCFLVMMLNVPVFGGTTAHAVGAVLVAVIAGPWMACLAVTAALVVQALLFGDGGILTLGINCLNMAVVMPFVGYGVYRFILGRGVLRSPRRLFAAGAGTYAGIVTAAALAGIELGIQPALHSAHGIAEYAPYGLSTAFPAMVLSHLAIAGPVEVLFTVAALAFLTRTEPELLAVHRPAATRTGWLYGLVAVLVALTPLGLLASGTAWSEWGTAELRGRIGYVPHGLRRLGGLWKGILPDYGFPNGAWAVVGYVTSAVLGVALLAGLAWLAARLRRRRAADKV
jgi:cobalt/nickel transport system permease protein